MIIHCNFLSVLFPYCRRLKVLVGCKKLWKKINNNDNNNRIVDFPVPDVQRVKEKENEKKDKYPDLAWKLKKKTVQHESEDYTKCNWCFWYSHQKIGERTWWLRNKRTSGDSPNNSVTEIGQNTEKSPGDLNRLVVTQTSMKDHKLTLMWKTFKE